MRKSVETALKQAFRPELLNRIDDVLIFHPLTQENLEKIVDLIIKDVVQRLAERNLSLELSAKAKAWLAKKGYDPIYGARPLRRVVQRYIENPISTGILQGKFKEGVTIIIDVQDNNLSFSPSKPTS